MSQLYKSDRRHIHRVLRAVAEREFLHFWERSICASMHADFWLARVMGPAPISQGVNQ